MQTSTAFRLSAATAFLGVALGAFGAHVMQAKLAAFGTTEIWHTATLYHLVHAVTMLVISREYALRKASWWLFFVGIIIFSGSLYLFCITNVKLLGAITPLGGLALLVGWAWLIFPQKEA